MNRTVIPNHSAGERREFGIFPGRCWGEMIGGKFRATPLWKAEGEGGGGGGGGEEGGEAGRILRNNLYQFHREI